MPDYDSPFFITNDRADIDQARIEDGTAVVWPLSDDAKLVRSPDRQYCGNYVTYGDKSASTYRHNADTHALIAAGPNQHRDMVSSFPLVKTKAKAQARGDRQLLDVQDQDVRITTRLENVPITRATLAKAGMRLQIKGTHWGPTCDDWHYARIVAAEPQPHGAGELCDISLELVMGMPVETSLSPGPPPPPPSETTAGAVLWEPGSTFAAVPATSGDITWHGSGDNPGTGYPGPGGGGPIDSTAFAYLGTYPNHEGFEVLAANGALDIHIELDLADAIVGPARTYTLRLLLNGAPIATDAHTGGPGGVYEFFTIDMADLVVVAGDELRLDMTTSSLSGHSIPGGTGATSNRFQILGTSLVTR